MKVALALLALLAAAFAEDCSVAYGQCGGQGWTGATCCVAGSTCVATNSWFSQCVPGSGSTSGSTSGGSSTGSSTSGSSSTGSSSTGSTTGNTGSQKKSSNPFVGYHGFSSPFYAKEVKAAANAIKDPHTKSRALAVAKIPSFTWLDTIAKVSVLEELLKDARAHQNKTHKKQLVQIVVYDLPNRDCAAKASNGELQLNQDGANKYKTYIDSIVNVCMKYSDVRVVAVVEPDSLANLVTNINLPTCAAAADAYRTLTVYAIQQLSKAKVIMYLDAGHGGWLGWDANLGPAAKLFGDIYQQAGGSTTTVRGLVTNTANYNPLNIAVPEPYTAGNKNYDEMHYIKALAPLLTANGFPAHFIVDQGRSGKTGMRTQWGDWCNIKGAGFGLRPTTKTGVDILDAIVWVKPGGESDGTSDSQSKRFDSTCALGDTLQPAPEAGTWFQAYFEMLLANATPPI